MMASRPPVNPRDVFGSNNDGYLCWSLHKHTGSFDSVT